jgi:hypothetical protein
MGQALKNNQEPSFTRLWKWRLLRLNQSSLKPKALIAIGVELSGLKGKIASALEKNEKLAPIAIGVEVRSQLETEGADRKQIEAQLSELKKNSAPAATLLEKSTPDVATVLSQLARQTQKIPGVPRRHRGNFRDYRGVLRRHIPGTLGINPGSFRGFSGQNLNNSTLTKWLKTCDRK